MTDFKPFKHQEAFADLWGEKKRVLNLDGCGTGKTLACIHAVKTHWPEARVLVLAPLSILETAWVKDLQLGWKDATYAVASKSLARKRKALYSDAKWVIANHDTVKLIDKDNIARNFDVLIIDEGDVFRNRQTARSRAAVAVAHQIPIISLMTGTPTPKSVTDIWHLAFLVDKGERLGNNFFRFRQEVCTPRQVFGAPPNAMEWVDKEGANDHVTLMLSDISTRVTLDDVTELPDTIYRDIYVELPQKVRAQYDFLRRESLLALDNGEVINAIHAGARMQKLLQTLSGAVYDESGEVKDLHETRHSLIIDLVKETDHALVAFNWTHQREGLIRAAKREGLSYAVIDGSVPSSKRTQIVNDFQAGKIHVIFAHPQSAGHGLTLTRANRIIWASPTYRADLYEQFNHRIIRTGQKRKTEIIHIAAEDSAEIDVYEKLLMKKGRMMNLLGTLAELAKAA